MNSVTVFIERGCTPCCCSDRARAGSQMPRQEVWCQKIDCERESECASLLVEQMEASHSTSFRPTPSSAMLAGTIPVEALRSSCSATQGYRALRGLRTLGGNQRQAEHQ